jgi:hypothetical protein
MEGSNYKQLIRAIWKRKQNFKEYLLPSQTGRGRGRVS